MSNTGYDLQLSYVGALALVYDLNCLVVGTA
jgi:hypothetical protein